MIFKIGTVARQAKICNFPVFNTRTMEINRIQLSIAEHFEKSLTFQFHLVYMQLARYIVELVGLQVQKPKPNQ